MATERVPDTARLHPNDEEVAAKLVGGEVILVNLADGTYYSIQGTGAHLWAALTAGKTVGEATAALVAAWDTDAATVPDDVQSFLASALTAQLLLPGAAGSPAEHADEDLPTPGAYEPPVIEAYSDMNELLALDPPMPNLTDLNWDGA